MSDTRAAIRELRSLSEKRSTQGLTEQEQSRLAELRERLGLPSEPAEGRPIAPPAMSPAAAPVPAASGAPVAAASLPRLDAFGPSPLPRLETAMPVPEAEGSPGQDALPDLEAVLEPLEPAGLEPTPDDVLEPLEAANLETASESVLEPLEVADLEPAAEPVLEPLEAAGLEPTAEALLDSLEAAEMEPSAQVAEAEAPQPPPRRLTLAERIAAAEAAEVPVAAEVDETPLAAEAAEMPLPVEAAEMALPLEAAEMPLPVEAAEMALPLEAAEMPLPVEAAEMPLPVEAAETPLAAEADEMPLPVEAAEMPLPVEAAETPLAAEADELPWPTEAAEMPLPAEEAELPWPTEEAELPLPTEAAEMPLPTEAAEMPLPTEAAEMPLPAEAAEAEAVESGASDGWGAVPVSPEPVFQDLGATPLDDASPAELGFSEDAAPIELSSADVILLENDSALEADLGGQPEDPVPLAALHEFVGAQPEDPRALALDDAEEQPTFAAEDLQATEAELAAAPEAFQPSDAEEPPELDPEPPPPPPAPAAPRIVVPRPPTTPAPFRPAAAAPPVPPPQSPPPPAARAVVIPQPPEAAAAAPPPRGAGLRAAAPSFTGGARTAVPPPPPAAAYVMSEDGRRLPALSAARPEPPQLAHQFGGSGPFARNKAVLLAQAPLDVMEDGDAVSAEPTPPPLPQTDVATGAEVFGGAYLSPTFVEGEHRVVLHTLEGQVRRGMVKDLDLLDPVIRLAQPGRPPEAIAAERVKAIFFMQEPGTAPLPSAGRRIRVGFSDGRQIVGFSEDVDAGEQGFFLIPADTRTHTARIYVFRAGIQSISAA